MRTTPLVLASLVAITAALCSGMPAAADSGPEATAMDFAVMRNGERIGTSTVRLRRSGAETIADVATRIEVKIAFVTVYRYEQSEIERWADGRLVAMSSHTDDNGTVHRVSAARNGDRLVVETDGRRSEVDPGLMPFSPWNAELLRKTVALSTKDGSVTPVAVTDHGEEQLVVRGRATRAHHYSIRTSFPQEVWYDEHRRLVQVELHGSDGSKIRYQLG